jgi:hypothetical protein
MFWDTSNCLDYRNLTDTGTSTGNTWVHCAGTYRTGIEFAGLWNQTLIRIGFGLNDFLDPDPGLGIRIPDLGAQKGRNVLFL